LLSVAVRLAGLANGDSGFAGTLRAASLLSVAVRLAGLANGDSGFAGTLRAASLLSVAVRLAGLANGDSGFAGTLRAASFSRSRGPLHATPPRQRGNSAMCAVRIRP